MLPPIDLGFVSDQLADLGEEIQRTFDELTTPVEPPPQVLLLGLERLLDTLRKAERDTPAETGMALRSATGSEPEVLLDHGLSLLDQLAHLAERIGLPRSARAVGQLSIPLGCWMLRRGAELLHPAPVINAAALLANRLRQPEELTELFGIMSEIMNGIGAERALELEATNPARPWRVLLLNRAIVATRSQQPILMENAFDTVIEQLPEEAPDFFREGMGQVETLDYPAQVRELMQRYFERWCTGQRLH